MNPPSLRGESGRILVNAGWLYLDQAVRAVAVLAAFSLMARSLGPEQFGWLSYAIAFPGMFVPVAMLGLDYVVMRDFVRHPEEREAILGTAAGLKIGASLLAFVLTVGAAVALPIGAAARSLVLVTSLSLLTHPLLVLDYYFQSQVAAKYSAVARMAACLVANGARIWCAWREAPVEWFAWVFVGEAVCYAAGLVLAWRSSGGRAVIWLPPGWQARARRMWSSAWPIFLADVAIAGYLRVDQVLLRHLAGPAELGRYAAAYRLADAAEFVALALINSHFPRVVRLHASGAAAFEREVARLLRQMTWVAIFVALGLTLGAPWITATVLGPGFTDVWPVLVLLTWANVFVTQIAVRGKWFLAEGLQIWSLWCFVLGAALHLTALWWVVPRWGALGAAGSFFVAQVVISVIAPVLFPRIRRAAGLALRSFWPGRNSST